MAAQPKQKTSKVRSKTRRAHRHDSIKDANLWQGGMLSKKERMEEFAKYRRRKTLKSTPTETVATKETTTKAPKTAVKTPTTKPAPTKKPSKTTKKES
jgi:hypothetical protein